MQLQQQYNIFPLGDAALLLQLGNTVDAEVNKAVLHFFHQLKVANLPFIKDVIPAYSSLAVYYDVYFVHRHYSVTTAFEFVAQQIQQTIQQTFSAGVPSAGRRLSIPVCYEGLYAPDIEALAAQKNVTVADVVAIHTATIYTVYMIGFLPGFAYMGTVDDRIATPRKKEPRLQVEKGSVGIAGAQTGIYPMASPGGWQIIGRTPMLIFDKEAQQPVALAPGDEVQFYSITANEFKNY